MKAQARDFFTDSERDEQESSEDTAWGDNFIQIRVAGTASARRTTPAVIPARPTRTKSFTRTRTTRHICISAHAGQTATWRETLGQRSSCARNPPALTYQPRRLAQAFGIRLRGLSLLAKVSLPGARRGCRDFPRLSRNIKKGGI